MQPTIEILEKININSNKNSNEIFTRLYRYLLREDIYYIAYKRLYSNNGASTRGVDDDTADGFSREYVLKIIESLKNETYIPKPVRREYIKKSNNKKRPLGLPTFTDKLVQEVIRMILEAIYEPLFFECSHGFRPEKSCHTALTSIKYNFTGIRWFVEGDISGCFDNINHNKLTEIIGGKIKDTRFIVLIRKFLKAGYLEDFKYYNTYSGTPQGGIISPILANIYLHELDKFIINLKKDFDKPAIRKINKEYRKISYRKSFISEKIDKADGEVKQKLFKEYKDVSKLLRKIPSKSQTDKKITYVRYADDFLLGLNASKDECIEIKDSIKEFLKINLDMELSEEKTFVTHSNAYARFLGYDIRVRRDGTVRPDKNGVLRKFLNGKVELSMPIGDKINKFLFNKKAVIVKNGVLFPVSRNALTILTDLEIITTYNAEIRGLCNYYSLAVNYHMLDYFSYLMEYSCLKTLAHKHKSKISKVKKMFKDGRGKWGVPYKTKKESKRMYIVKSKDIDRTEVFKKVDEIPKQGIYLWYSTNTFENKLKEKVCELCGSTTEKEYEIHHVNKVKNLKGKKQWEKIMIAKRRKTLLVCKPCHYEIHGRKMK